MVQKWHHIEGKSEIYDVSSLDKESSDFYSVFFDDGSRKLCGKNSAWHLQFFIFQLIQLNS